MFFKCLGSQHIHKDIKLQEGMNRIDYILCKTDLNLIQRLTYKCNTFNDVHFEACFKSFVVFTISSKACFEGGGFLSYNDLDLN